MTAALLTSSSFRSRSVRGLVVVGKRIGRTIGFPTANLAPCDTTIAPPSGVYATTVSLESGAVWPAATNVGVRPTVTSDGELLIETHLIGFDGDLYDQFIEIEFHHRIRAERRFDGLDDLKAQLGADVRRVADLLRPGVAAAEERP